MGIYEFNKLSEYEQGDIVFNKGQFIDVLIDDNHRYALYSISMFWVEVTYNASDNQIICIHSFISGEILNKFSNLPKKL